MIGNFYVILADELCLTKHINLHHNILVIIAFISVHSHSQILHSVFHGKQAIAARESWD